MDLDYPKAIRDYREPEQYPKGDDSDHFWQWEFVRRNIWFQISADDPELTEVSLDPDELDEWYSTWHYKEDHSEEEIAQNASQGVMPPWRVCGPLSGGGLDDRGEPYYDITRYSDPMGMLSEFGLLVERAREHAHNIDDRLLIVALDVAASSTPQLEKVKQMMSEGKALMKKTGWELPAIRGRRKDKLEVLLRILDGRADGASTAEIMEATSINDPADFYTRLKDAENLVSGDYRLLGK